MIIVFVRGYIQSVGLADRGMRVREEKLGKEALVGRMKAATRQVIQDIGVTRDLVISREQTTTFLVKHKQLRRLGK